MAALPTRPKNAMPPEPPYPCQNRPAFPIKLSPSKLHGKEGGDDELPPALELEEVRVGS